MNLTVQSLKEHLKMRRVEFITWIQFCIKSSLDRLFSVFEGVAEETLLDGWCLRNMASYYENDTTATPSSPNPIRENTDNNNADMPNGASCLRNGNHSLFRDLFYLILWVFSFFSSQFYIHHSNIFGDSKPRSCYLFIFTGQ